jgi:hypothetical protein
MIALKKSVTVFKNNSGEKSLRWLQDSVEYSIELKSVLSLMDDAENIATTSTSPKTTLIIVAPTTNNSASFSATVVFDVAKKQAIFVNSETNKQLFTSKLDVSIANSSSSFWLSSILQISSPDGAVGRRAKE